MPTCHGIVAVNFFIFLSTWLDTFFLCSESYVIKQRKSKLLDTYGHNVVRPCCQVYAVGEHSFTWDEIVNRRWNFTHEGGRETTREACEEWYVFREVCLRFTCTVWLRSKQLSLLFCFPSECLIKSLINPRDVTKMESTFGTWMKDTALLNDERIWVAEHFSGSLVKEDHQHGCRHLTPC